MMQRRLREGGDLARSALRDIVPEGISMVPDASGSFLWCVFADGVGTLFLDINAPDYAAMFAPIPQVDNNGSGGVIWAVPSIPQSRRVK
ncbi:MAG: hypothetical protein ACRD3O_00330 [Terriglobia bacterium]